MADRQSVLKKGFKGTDVEAFLDWESELGHYSNEQIEMLDQGTAHVEDYGNGEEPYVFIAATRGNRDILG